VSLVSQDLLDLLALKVQWDLMESLVCLVPEVLLETVDQQDHQDLLDRLVQLALPDKMGQPVV